jgi:hypothetical protein
MKKAYDSRGAERLIPLLRQIQKEIRQRSDSIRKCYVQIKGLGNSRKTLSGALRAEISNHKREIRHARKEFDRLGCLIDETAPYRVLIPGADGTNGFAWELGETTVREVVSEGADKG